MFKKLPCNARVQSLVWEDPKCQEVASPVCHTYCEDRADRAELYHHSTAAQAAKVAKDAHVKKLILGHYSARYNDEEQIVKEARSIFPESYLTAENDVFEL